MSLCDPVFAQFSAEALNFHSKVAAAVTGKIPVAGSKESLMKKHFSTIILFLVFGIGLCLLLYPTVSDYWNSFHQSRAIASYTDAVAQMDEKEYEKIWADAVLFNDSLKKKSGNRYVLTEEERQWYNSLLNVSGSGVMGYIEIPSVDVSLALYHGTEESVLQVAVGHIEGSSLPVGGESTHCVLSGHRGLPSARLFTDLDKLIEGDVFLLHILDETLTYEVDQILIVDPDSMEALEIMEGKDYCTLVTCTPYGVNSHRMLVRGHRIENELVANIRVTADATRLDPIVVAPAIAIPILLILLLWMLIKYRKR